MTPRQIQALSLSVRSQLGVAVGLNLGRGTPPTPPAEKRSFETQFEELEERSPCDLGAAVITPFEVRHPSGAPAYALRIEYGGKIIAYSGDTEWTDSLLAAAQGADLFICEAYFYEKRVPYHLDYQTLLAKRAELDEFSGR